MKLKDLNNIYFHREILYYSLEGRKIEVVTITSKDGITSTREDLPEAEDS